MTRILPKTAFIQSPRKPLIYFVTSNEDKMFQARLIFSKFGLELQSFQRPPEYLEDYAQGKEKLLEVGVREVAGALGSSDFFFLEDTSVRIEAISEQTDEPGLAIKEWFTPQRMQDLADRIVREELDPAATVKSDIALHVPGLSRPVFFSGETTGRIAPVAPDFDRDPRYPWLRPDTFNGWLIPDGYDQPLGSLSFDSSMAVDFRARALVSLVERLEEYAVVLNAPPHSYAVRTKPGPAQPQLPLANRPALMVIGQTCSGKTTFGERASFGTGLTHIEASHVMRTIPLPEESDSVDSFARANLLMLRGGADVVARRITEIYGDALAEGFVITGFRTLQELAFLKERFPWALVVSIEASEPTRYDRYLLRDRPDDTLTLERFRQRDSEHKYFGLLNVGDHVADVRLKNEGSLEDYLAQVDSVVDERWTRVRGITPALPEESMAKSQLVRVLLALEGGSYGLTPQEIEVASATSGRIVRRSSARKVLAEFEALVRRTGDPSGVSYALSDAGHAYLQLLRARGLVI